MSLSLSISAPTSQRIYQKKERWTCPNCPKSLGKTNSRAIHSHMQSCGTAAPAPSCQKFGSNTRQLHQDIPDIFLPPPAFSLSKQTTSIQSTSLFQPKQMFTPINQDVPKIFLQPLFLNQSTDDQQSCTFEAMAQSFHASQVQQLVKFQTELRKTTMDCVRRFCGDGVAQHLSYDWLARLLIVSIVEPNASQSSPQVISTPDRQTTTLVTEYDRAINLALLKISLQMKSTDEEQK